MVARHFGGVMSSRTQEATRVALAETSSIHADLLAEAIGRDRRLNVVHATSSATELARKIGELHPDVVVLSASLELEAERGFELMQHLRASDSSSKFIILLDRSTPDQVVKAFRSGARGVFCRNTPVKNLCKCIRVVQAGQIWANNEELGYVFEALATAPVPRTLNSIGLRQLSQRERDVVRCLTEGMSNRAIAQELSISQHTVKNYMFKIFDRLGVSSRVELLFYVFSQPSADLTSVRSLGGRNLREEVALQSVDISEHRAKPAQFSKPVNLAPPDELVVNKAATR